MANGAELTGLFAYLSKDDELKTQQIAYAIVKALGGEQKGQKQQPAADEEIIDTTDPKFAEQFQGFTYANPQPRKSRQTSTEILFG